MKMVKLTTDEQRITGTSAVIGRMVENARWQYENYRKVFLKAYDDARKSLSLTAVSVFEKALKESEDNGN